MEDIPKTVENIELTVPKSEKGSISARVGVLLMYLLVPGALISFILSCVSFVDCSAEYTLGCGFVLFFEWVIIGFELAITFICLLVSLKNREKPIHKDLWKVELGVFIVLLIALGLSVYPEWLRLGIF